VLADATTQLNAERAAVNDLQLKVNVILVLEVRKQFADELVARLGYPLIRALTPSFAAVTQSSKHVALIQKMLHASPILDVLLSNNLQCTYLVIFLDFVDYRATTFA
jgi:hypothetical protein